jgi:hypothetical protein
MDLDGFRGSFSPGATGMFVVHFEVPVGADLFGALANDLVEQHVTPAASLRPAVPDEGLALAAFRWSPPELGHEAAQRKFFTSLEGPFGIARIVFVLLQTDENAAVSIDDGGAPDDEPEWTLEYSVDDPGSTLPMEEPVKDFPELPFEVEGFGTSFASKRKTELRAKVTLSSPETTGASEVVELVADFWSAPFQVDSAARREQLVVWDEPKHTATIEFGPLGDGAEPSEIEGRLLQILMRTQGLVPLSSVRFGPAF